MQKNNMRQSNFELLRIIAIIGIIIDHIFNFGVRLQITNGIYGAGQMFNALHFYKRLTAVEICISFGAIGNMLFLMLAGYFMIKKDKIDINKQILKIISQLIYATIFIALLSFGYYKFVDNKFIGLVAINFFNDGWWYAGYYLTVITIAYLFLNKFLNGLDFKKYTTFILVLFVIISASFTRTLFVEISTNLFTLIIGIFAYSLGGYFSKYNPLKNVKNTVLVISVFIVLVLMGLSYYNNTVSNINKLILNSSFDHTQEFYIYPNWSLWTLIIAICIFEIFSRIKIKKSKAINFIASAMFIVYIMHVNDFAKALLIKINWIEPYHNNLLLFFGMLMLVMLIILSFGIFAYIIYKLLCTAIKSEKLKKIIMK